MGKRMKSVGYALLIVALLSAFIAPVALAFETREGGTVIIGAEEVIEDDLFVGAETFILEGTVKGDLFVAGSEITINGVIEGDLWAAGQRILINGELMDDAMVAGYLLELGPSAVIGDDLRAAGFSLEAARGSQVVGSLLLGGYQTVLAGDVSEDAWVGANALELDGSVGGNLNAGVGSGDAGMMWLNPSMINSEMPTVNTLPGGLRIAETAKVGGDLSYTSPQEAVIPSGSVAGRVDFTLEQIKRGPDRPFDIPVGGVFGAMVVAWIFGTLRRVLALLLVGLLIAWLAPKWITRPAEAFKAKPWASLGWGALTYFLFPVAVVVAVGVVGLLAFVLWMVTLGNLGMPVALLGGSAILVAIVLYTLILSYLTKVMAGYVIGRLLFPSEAWARKPLLPTLIGVLFVAILIRIPFIGWLLGFAISLFGLGALWLTVAERKNPTPTPPAA